MRISDWSSDVCSSDLDTKEEGLFSPCNHSHNGAVRRGGFGTMKTILLPVEEQPSVEPTIDTAVLLAAVFGSYVEGFALTPDPPPLVSAEDRRSVVQGRRGSVSVGTGGSRFIKKN